MHKQPKRRPPGNFTAPTPGVEIDLGDGAARLLRYSLRSFQMMDERKLRRGASLGSELAELIWIGLHDPVTGVEPEGVTLDQLRGLDVTWFPYLRECYELAFEAAFRDPDQKKDETATAAAG